MSPQIAQLLALIPEEGYEAFVQRLPRPAVQAIARLSAEVDESVLQQIAEAVWDCLEQPAALSLN